MCTDCGALECLAQCVSITLSINSGMARRRFDHRLTSQSADSVCRQVALTVIKQQIYRYLKKNLNGKPYSSTKMVLLDFTIQNDVNKRALS